MIKIATCLIAIITTIVISAAVSQTLQQPSGSSLSFSAIPAGSISSPALSFAGDSVGWYQNSAGQWTWETGGNTSNISLIAGLIRMRSTESLCWSSADSSTTGCDTGASRSAAGIIAIGNGSSGNTAGGLVTATATLNALTAGTNADFLCLSANGTILLQNSACTISSLRFKPDWKPYQDDAISKIAKFDVGKFHVDTGPNRDPNASLLQAGLSAESVAAVAPECAIYENDMKTPKSYRQECVIALLVRAVQEMKIKR